MMLKSLIASGLLSLGMGLAVAAPVEPTAIWYDGLSKIQGTFKFVQIASPGGLWLEQEVAEGKVKARQVAINEVPETLRIKISSAKLTFTLAGASTREASQDPSPGQRGQAPYHGHIRHYTELARGELSYSGLPGIGAEDGDKGEFSGKVEMTLQASYHSDPSDNGILQERIAGEMIWGPAAQSRNYADFSAVPLGAGDDDLGAMVNARLLRGGREIVVYTEWVNPTPPTGVLRERVRGAVRLVRAE